MKKIELRSRKIVKEFRRMCKLWRVCNAELFIDFLQRRGTNQFLNKANTSLNILPTRLCQLLSDKERKCRC